jgi:hypothetical protein
MKDHGKRDLKLHPTKTNKVPPEDDIALSEKRICQAVNQMIASVNEQEVQSKKKKNTQALET